MKLLTTILLLLISVSVFSQTHKYYFDATLGNDSYTSVQAQNPSTPWKSLTKLNAFATSLVPGDSVLFKCGETFYGKIAIGKSGTSAQTIVYSSYGSGAKPIITGLSTVSSWTNISGNIWESSSAVITSSNMLNMVTVNGSLQPIGRYPKSSYLTITSHTWSGSGPWTGSVTGVLAGSTNYTGGQVVMRKNHYVMESALITSQTYSGGSTTVNFTQTGGDGYAPTNGFGFFFQNNVNACTQQGDWYFNTSTKKIGMYSVGSPSNVQVSSIDTLINLNNFSYITFSGLNLKGANVYIAFLGLGATSNNFVFSNCDFSFSGVNGLYSQNELPHNVTVSNCTFNYINNTGIDVQLATYFSIKYSSFKNIGIIAGMGKSGQQMYGVNYLGSNGIFQYNTIDSTGYTGCRFGGTNINVSNNFIQHFCLVDDDGAGVYTATITNTGTVVSSNIILNGIGAGAGTSDGENIAHGIYMDDNVTGVSIINNTSANNAYSGIYLHKNQTITATGNTLFNNGVTQFLMSDATAVMAGLLIKNNIAFSKTSGQYVSTLEYKAAHLPSTWGLLDSNYYCRPINESADFDYNNLDGSENFYSLSQYQSASGQDVHSKKTPKTVTDTSQILFYYNATNSATTTSLSASYIDVYSNPYLGSITLQPYTSSVLIFQSNVIPLTVTAIQDAINCNGDSTNLTLTAVGGVPNYTYSLDGLSWQSSNVFRVIAGFTTIYAKDAASTIAGNSFLVSQPSAITASVSFGLAPTTVTTTASGGTGTLTYKLDAGSYQSSNIFNSVAAGNHTITVKDANACTTVVSFTVISGGTPLTISNIVQNGEASCYGGTTTATVTATGGTAPYTYLWSNSQTTQTATNLTATTYTVTVTDAASHVADTSITITQPTIISIIQITADSLIATNGGTTQLHYSATGGTGSLQYKLDGGSYSSADSTGGVSAGNHVLYVKDANGCVVSQAFTLTQPPPAVPASINSFRTKRRRYFNG